MHILTREQHMETDTSLQTTSSEDLPRFPGDLFDNALEIYEHMVFWNGKPKRNMDGYRTAISALKKRGDPGAARLADRMEKAIDNSPRKIS